MAVRPPRYTERMGLPARPRVSPPVMEFAVSLAPDAVIGHLLARPDVAEERGDGHGRDPGYELQRTADGFTLISDPGDWRPGSRAICEAHLAPIEGGARLLVRVRLHPLTRTAFAFVIALGLAMTAFQWFIAGPALALSMLGLFGIVVGLLAADRSHLRRQQRALRMLVESTFTPLALPHEPAAAGPFRRTSAGES